MNAIKAGVVTASTKHALETAEAQEKDAQFELQAVERYEPTQVLPRAHEIYRDMVAKLEAVEDVSAAREALRELIGEVRLIPENGTLTAEMQSPGLAGALQTTLVAGTGFNIKFSQPVTLVLPATGCYVDARRSDVTLDRGGDSRPAKSLTHRDTQPDYSGVEYGKRGEDRERA